MPVMDNPEVPPAVHVRVDRDVEKDYAVRPIGQIKVTMTVGLVDKYFSGARQLVVRSAPIRDEGDPPGPVRDEGEPPDTLRDEGEPPGSIRDEGEPPGRIRDEGGPPTKN